MKSINVGLFGLGVVGCGVLDIMRKNRELIRSRLGAELRVTRAVTAHPDKSRPVSLEGITVSDDPATILGDPEVHIVAELIGGVDLAREVVIAALDAGKDVALTNKQVKSLASDHALYGRLGLESTLLEGNDLKTEIDSPSNRINIPTATWRLWSMPPSRGREPRSRSLGLRAGRGAAL